MSLENYKHVEGAWIGVDLDGTLSKYDPSDYGTVLDFGEPILPMVHRIKYWLKSGYIVKIVTARVNDEVGGEGGIFDMKDVRHAIESFLVNKCGLPILEITCKKDWKMLELWDDRVVQLEMNTGKVVGSEIFEK